LSAKKGRVLWNRQSVAGALVAATLSASILHSWGQPLWCRCGRWVPWAWNVDSMHNSQHLVDPYSPTHVLHGLLFYLFLWPLGRWLPLWARAALAIAIESAWEILENSPLIIERYRSATISLDYSGDSVLNSLSDIGMCAIGFTLAANIPVGAAIALFVLTELVLAATIRDGLLLNIVMLIHPIPAIRAWQAG
jgi:hypothetical protein